MSEMINYTAEYVSPEQQLIDKQVALLQATLRCEDAGGSLSVEPCGTRTWHGTWCQILGLYPAPEGATNE